jgi:hypothetical protein
MAEETQEAAAQEETEGSQLRRKMKEAETKAEQWRNEVLKMRVKEIGLSPDEGLGIAVLETFDGDPTPDGVKAFASERYKYQVPASSEEVATRTAAPAGRIDTVANSGGSIEPPPQVDPLVEADKKLADPEATRQDAINALTMKTARMRGSQ